MSRNFDTHNFRTVKPFPASYGAAQATGLWTGLLFQADFPPKQYSTHEGLKSTYSMCVQGKGFLETSQQKGFGNINILKCTNSPLGHGGWLVETIILTSNKMKKDAI